MTCIGWPNGEKLVSTCLRIWAGPKSTQVHAGGWPNETQVERKSENLCWLVSPFGQPFSFVTLHLSNSLNRCGTDSHSVGPTLYRLDRDDGYSALTTPLSNVAKLLRGDSDIDTKLRRLIIDLEPPSFSRRRRKDISDYFSQISASSNRSQESRCVMNLDFYAKSLLSFSFIHSFIHSFFYIFNTIIITPFLFAAMWPISPIFQYLANTWGLEVKTNS